MAYWPGWYMYYGKYWMFQYCLDGWISLGIHIDPRFRRTGRTQERFGPYIDLHLGPCIFSFGINPVLSGEYDVKSSASRNGFVADD